MVVVRWMKRGPESSDSDSSIDQELSVPSPRAPSGHDTADIRAVSHEEYGIGASLMAKMGFKIGQGLGVDQQGITAPIAPAMRVKNVGLGAENSGRPGYRKAVSYPVNESALPPDSNQLAKEARLAQLKNVLDSLDSSNSQQFITAFGSLPLWHELRLWEALLAKLPREYADLPFAEFGKHHEELHLIQAVLPDRYWLAFIRDNWLPKMPHNAETIPGVLNQIEVLRGLLPPEIMEGPVTEYFLERIHEILGDTVTLERVQRLWPQFLLTASRVLPNSQFSLAELRLLDNVHSQVRSQLEESRGDLSAIAATLTEWKSELSDEEHAGLLHQFFVPQWLNDLETLAFNNTLTRNWWNTYRPFVPQEDLLLKGLNIINYIRDTQRVPTNEDLTSPEPQISLSEALNHYCYMRDYECHFKSPNRGIITGPNASVSWEVTDNILYLTERRTPASFLDIQKFV